MSRTGRCEPLQSRHSRERKPPCPGLSRASTSLPEQTPRRKTWVAGSSPATGYLRDDGRVWRGTPVSLSTPFIERPVATTLLTIGVALAGLFAFGKLPVAPLPQVDFPTISVFAQMPGASPETMATTVATSLERHLGVIADVTEITSQSTVGSTRITLQFGLSRNIDGAARDVQAAINAARVDLPSSLRTNPTYRKVNPADAPILILSLTSDTETRGQMYDAASTILQPALSQ